VNGRGNRGPA